jgi:hypothetical protein
VRSTEAEEPIRSTAEARNTEARPMRSTAEVDDKERPMRSTQSTAEERLMRSTAKAAEEASRGEAKKQHRCEAQVSCGAPRNRGGTPMRGRRGAPMRGAGFVWSTEEPRGNTDARPKRSTDARPKRSTDARPKRSTDARRRFRAEHRGTEGKQQPTSNKKWS